jgi:predicted deacylase
MVFDYITVDEMEFYTTLELLIYLIDQYNLMIDEAINLQTICEAEVNELFQRLIEDGTLVDILGTEVVQEIKARLNKLEAKQIDGFYYRIKDLDNLPANHQDFTVDDYYQMFDSLQIDTRFRRRDMGKDASGTYDIPAYIYKPTYYQSTILIACAIHGWEHIATYAMYRLMKLLLDDTKLPNQFQSLRESRLIIVPVVNPWGLMAENHQGVGAIRRGNANGVDLNRNFDYNWAANAGNFGLSKGTEAFSEAESKILKELLESYNVSYVVDFHSFYKQDERDLIFYGCPAEQEKYNTEQMIKSLKAIYPNIVIEHTVTQNDSSFNNYASCVRKIPSMNLELVYDSSKSVETEVSRLTEVAMNFLNLISCSYKLITPNTTMGSKVAQRENTTATQTVGTSWTEITSLGFSYDVNDTDGIMMVDGWIVIKGSGTDSSSTVTVTYGIEQTGYYTQKSITSRARYTANLINGNIVLPISCRYPCKRGYGQATFKCQIIKEGSGSATMQRKDATYLFIPCNNSYVLLGQHNKEYEY